MRKRLDFHQSGTLKKSRMAISAYLHSPYSEMWFGPLFTMSGSRSCGELRDVNMLCVT